MLVLDGNHGLSGGLINASAGTGHVTGSAWEFVGGTTAGPQINGESVDLGAGAYTAMLRTTATANRRTFTLTFTLTDVPRTFTDPYTFKVTDISLEETTGMTA